MDSSTATQSRDEVALAKAAAEAAATMASAFATAADVSEETRGTEEE